MRPQFRAIMIFIGVILLVVGVVRAQEATPEFEVAERTYELYIPEGYQEDISVPLLLVLHGASGNGARSQAWLGFDALADAKNFIVAYPNGLYNNWDFGAGVPTPDGDRVTVDDVGYLTGLVDDLAEAYSIDRTRVFVAGNSNGALMAYRLACEAPDTFRAVAGVAAGVFVMAVRECGEVPIPVLFIQGTDDRILPWDGTRLNGQYVGLSAADSLAFWAGANGCDTSADAVIQTELADTDPDDISTVTQLSLNDCAGGAEVQFYAVVGGGHTWPGRPFDVGFDLGAVNMDMDATEVIWTWFAGFEAALAPEVTPPA